MAKVVLCSELGSGSRALARLADCADELKTQGHSVRLVCSDIAAAHRNESFAKISIFQAPKPVLPKRDKSWRLQNFTSILLANGFDSPATLTPVLRSWLHTLATLDVDLVVTDGAPVATLAAKLLMVPCAMVGNGYSVPPKTNPLPSLAPWKTTEGLQAQLEEGDQRLVATVNSSIQALNFEKVVLKEAYEIYSHADQWVMSFAEIDHYGRREADYVVRWTRSSTAVDPVWPHSPGTKIFAQLDAKSPHLTAVLEQLARRGDPTLVVIPNAEDSWIKQNQVRNIKIQNELVNIRRVIEQCRVVINNCNHDLIYELLITGTPSILLPNNPENMLLAYRVAKRKLGFPGPAKPDGLDLNKLIEKATTSDQIWANASRMSLKYENHHTLSRLHQLIAAKLEK
ncbi:hypothetical protein [Arenicella xantha]|uniref:UDP:flavonoid glycosyltransferase YjiC (YdhE family) n=1 Tax=Arenicella xantha TaxID=644221 RepID=A0A395JHD8_9GAMM|nr:hypothetical protein [Arenicella xantha]RBP49380.1 UDP:flavonoid glycosyltransferase YjiC (YdhE family) [Arenicella xantha]